MSEALFCDRHEAGRLLGELLVRSGEWGTTGGPAPVVLALPRGGVPVAVSVAAAVHGDLEVVVAVKIAQPGYPEVGVGAVAEDGPPVWDEQGLQRYGLDAEGLADSVGHARAEVERRVARYRDARPLPRLGHRDVLLVDDGIATGVTARATVRWLRTREPPPRRVVVAAPVCSTYAIEQACAEADRVLRLAQPDPFGSVSAWYDEFPQLTDEEVDEELRRSRNA